MCDENIRSVLDKCFYLGQLNLGPVLIEGSFVDSFEVKMMGIRTLLEGNTRSYEVVFGEEPKEECYWVKA